ncbi:MAG: zf-HC2 domain-containing protein [Dehalococcoidia bacterium]
MRDAAPIKCRELVELVTDYVEGALSPGARAHFEAHLRGCPWCTRYLEQMRRTIEMTGRLREEDLSPAMRTTLLAAFRAWGAGAL